MSTLNEDTIQILTALQALNDRQVSFTKQMIDQGIALEFITSIIQENYTEEEAAALEKSFTAYRDMRLSDIKEEWSKLKDQSDKTQSLKMDE